jgi:outer membrane lipoprotein SlyB
MHAARIGTEVVSTIECCSCGSGAAARRAEQIVIAIMLKEVLMKRIDHRIVFPLTLLAVVTACAQQPGYVSDSRDNPQSGYYAQTGVVERIEVVPKGASNSIAGTVIGGIVGGLIGSQIGGGSGRTAATIAGAAGGAVAGNAIEGRTRADHEAFRIAVRLDNGGYRTLIQENIRDLRTGDRVRIDGNSITRI